ncbi:hypothetical protein [Kitasatospora sp. NPDC050463]|uniref:hypothetical protein n=1 Tax=Kitasatospora sp. NPDC050463 TaxID=3155786 RepID=UPI0033D9A4B3
MTTTPSRRARRALGPGAARVLADTVRPPRTPPPWSPAAVEAALHAVLERFEQRAEPWREAFEGLDEDVLAEAAAEARAFSTDPAAAVDQLVRGLLLELDQWQQAISALGADLTATGRCPSGPSPPAGPRTSAGAVPAPRCWRPSPATTTATCPPRPAATGRGDHHRPARGRMSRVTSTQPRGIGSLIPTRAQATPGEKAAAQLAHLRTATIPCRSSPRPPS